MKDLYAILGIRKNASQKSIQKAYRKRAMETHPDRNGSKEEFLEVQMAYEILSDPDKKARYDSTGTYDEKVAPPIDPIENKAIVLISQTLGNTITELQNNSMITRMDLAQLLRNKIHGGLEPQRRQKGILEGFQKTVGSIKDRFVTPDGMSFISDIVAAHLHSISKDLERVAEGIAICERALLMLKDVRFVYDKEEPMAPGGLLGQLFGQKVYISFQGGI